MHNQLAPTLALRRWRIHQVIRSVGDAIKTYFDSWHGFFNITETAGDMLLFLFLYMGTLETDSQKCLMNMCMGYGVNGLLFMVSSVLSNPTAGTLPYIFYYHLFEWTAMLALIICGVKIIADKQGGGGATMQAIVAVLCGSIHAAHSGYIVYRQYIKES
ncbi:hypothetical protein HPB51_014805 [Rhipicephalus microplus]|uniref:Uncharacterized protein n=1 Tax=Rhipicephalus microplus TaxID=6941 RepID=A0A9J6DNE5_RHIMP|nr:hypothetical protein HPB51_014805 [Rhipicephalus microplus]